MKLIFIFCMLILPELLLSQEFYTSQQIDNMVFDKDEKAKRVTFSTTTVLQVQDVRYTIKQSTATIKVFTSSTQYTVPYPISGFSILCFGEGGNFSSNVGDINNVTLMDGIGFSINLDIPKKDAMFKFVLLPNTTIYFVAR